MSLSKKQRDEITKYRDAIEAMGERFTEVFAQAVSDADDAFDPVRDMVEDYNSAVSDYNIALEEIRADLQTTFDERSEKWQESEKGLDYAEWIRDFEVEAQEIEFDPPEADEPECDLPDEPRSSPQD